MTEDEVRAIAREVINGVIDKMSQKMINITILQGSASNKACREDLQKMVELTRAGLKAR